MDMAEFSALMNRFYHAATEVLANTHAFLDKFVGDEVVAIYLPVFTGEDHASPAVEAARELMRVTGHDDPEGPWVPIGIGVHTGPAYFGTVQGSEGALADLTALGDTVNVAARLASSAGEGEIIVSEEAAQRAGLVVEDFELRKLRLKGKSRPFPARVITRPARPSNRPTSRKPAAKPRRPKT